MSLLTDLSEPLPRPNLGELRELAAWARSLALVAGGYLPRPHTDILNDGGRQVPSSTLPVLAVHGYLANGNDLEPLAGYLRHHGFGQVFTYTANTQTRSVPELAERLVTHVRTILAATGHDRLHLVGHSLGGIVIRYAVTYLGLDRYADVVVTIGSPHGGSPLATATAGFLPAVIAKVPRALCPGSPILRALEADARPSQVTWVAIGSEQDHIVPADRARITAPVLAATNLTFADIGHLDLVFDRRVLDATVKALAAGETRRVGVAA